MQIFLLMILSAFMGGYHYLGSPALNVGHDFLPESVRTKSLIMCVINEQKNALDDNAKNLRENGFEFEKSAPCAKSKDVATTKFCMKDEGISSDCYGQEGYGEESDYLADHYFITRTDLPKDMSQSTALDYIKKMSGGLPNLGLLFKNEDGKYVVLNPQTMTETIEVPEELIGANSLRKHQIIYFSHHSPLEVEAIAESSEWEALECESESDIKVFDGETQSWSCRPFENFKKCFGDTIEDTKGNCVPNVDKKISCSADERATFNYEALAWECKRRLSVVCETNETLAWNGTLNKYVCVYNQAFTGSDCEDLVYNDQTDEWETIRLGGSAAGYPCGACEIHQSGSCDDSCFPDPLSIPENLCAGPSCAFECSDDEGCSWIENCNGGQNCTLYKTIYWQSDINKWGCVNCFPLKVKSKYRQCFNATIRDETGNVSVDSCSHYDGRYTHGVPEWDLAGKDSCYVIKNDKGEDELYCKFEGSGQYGEDGSGEKRFFCNTGDIDDTDICSTIGGTAWAWYDLGAEKCVDPYDNSEGDLQLLDKDTQGVPYQRTSGNKTYSFGCPAGYYRPRVANGQLQECEKKICSNQEPPLSPSYAERWDNEGCKAGYTEILKTDENNEGECFYCWIPPEDFNEPTMQKREFGIEYFSKQATTKIGQFSQVDSFEYHTACQEGQTCDGAEVSCYKDVDGYCHDTSPAHNSPPGWQRTWSNSAGNWSDPQAYWCKDHFSGAPIFPQDGDGQELGSWENKSQGRCPANYQTKLKGMEKNGTFEACIYCLPQPFKAEEFTSLLGSSDPNTAHPEIIVPQQPGAWRLYRCIEGVEEETYPYSDIDDIGKWTTPDYIGNQYAFARQYCDVSVVSEGCAYGTKRTWYGGWSNCEPNPCRAEDYDRAGAYIPMLLQKDTDHHCVYMWRPPYNGSPPYIGGETFADWFAYYYKNINWHDGSVELNQIRYRNDFNADGEPEVIIVDEQKYPKDGNYYVDRDLEYNEDGHHYTWDDDTGWDRKQIWCGTPDNIVNATEPNTLFPTTGQLDGVGETACYNTVQPSLVVWKGCKETHCADSECVMSSEFKNCLYEGCVNNSNCLKDTDTDRKAFEFCTAGLPSVSPWDPILGWIECETNWCRSDEVKRTGKHLIVLDDIKTCLYAWLPEYASSAWDGWKTNYAFDSVPADGTVYMEEIEALGACPSCDEDADGYLMDGGDDVYLLNGFKAVWPSDVIGWEVRPNWCSSENLLDTQDPLKGSFYPWTARLDPAEIVTCLRKTQPSFDRWGACVTDTNCPAGDCKTEDFQKCLYDECLGKTECKFTADADTSTICPSGDQVSNWDGGANGGWLSCGWSWCSDATDISDPYLTGYPWTARVVGACLEPVRATITIWNNCKLLHCEATDCSASTAFQSCLYENCKTDTACLQETDPNWSLEEVQTDKPVKQVWDGTPGTGKWGDRELNYCSTNTAPTSNVSKLFVTSRSVDSTLCAEIWLPDYTTWVDTSIKPTWELFENTTPIQDFDFLNCDGNGICPSDDDGKDATDCLSFLYRQWDETGIGWPVECLTEISPCYGETTSTNFFRITDDLGTQSDSDNCLRYHRPTWNLWNGDNLSYRWNGRKNNAWTVGAQDHIDQIEAYCDEYPTVNECADENATTRDGCSLSYELRTWSDGWPETCDDQLTTCGAYPENPGFFRYADASPNPTCVEYRRPSWLLWNAHSGNIPAMEAYCDSNRAASACSHYADSTTNDGCAYTFLEKVWADSWPDNCAVKWCTGLSDPAGADKRFLVDDGGCGKLWRPGYLVWNAAKDTATWDAYNSGGSFTAYNCAGNADCPNTNAASTDSAGCPLTSVERTWADDTGWSDCTTINWCSGYSAPTGNDQRFFVDDGTCAKLWQPDYNTWNTYQNSATWDVYNSGGNFLEYSNCAGNADCPDADGGPGTCAIPFLYRTWTDATGWSDCTEIDWLSGFSSPGLNTDDERFLVEDPTTAGKARLWVPPYNTWNSGRLTRTWNAFRGATGSTYAPYNCSGDANCPTNVTSDSTNCPLASINHTWTNATGWSDCTTINWCGGYNAPTGNDQRFFVDDGACAKLWQPDYNTWNTYKNSATWDVYSSGGNFTAYNCAGNTDCPDTDGGPGACSIPFLYRTWTDAAGWSGCTNVDWLSGFSSPGLNTDDERFLVEDSTTAGKARLWRPPYTTWNGTTWVSGGFRKRYLINSWNAYRGVTAYTYGVYDCSSSSCVDVDTKDHTGCLLFEYREWPNTAAGHATGWPSTCDNQRATCSGNTASTGFFRYADSSTNPTCTEYRRPSWNLWNTQGSVSAIENYCDTNHGNAVCDHHASTITTDGCSISFLSRTWSDGWPSTCDTPLTTCSGNTASTGFFRYADSSTNPTCTEYRRPSWNLWNTQGSVSAIENYCDSNHGNVICDHYASTITTDGCSISFLSRTWSDGWPSTCDTPLATCSGSTASAGFFRYADSSTNPTCTEYRRPSWDLWRGTSSNLWTDGSTSDMESYCDSNHGNAICDHHASTTTTDGCTIPFLSRVWSGSAWGDCTEIDWLSGFSSPGLSTDDERFLVEDPTTAGKARLWIPPYSTWDSGKNTQSWNAFRKASGYGTYSPYTGCTAATCGATQTTPLTETCSTGSYYYRQWTNHASGWPSTCSINWCSGASSLYNNGSSGFLLEATTPGTQVGPIADCAEASKPQPHRFHSGATTLTALRSDCNGDTHAGDADCFYKSGYQSANVEPGYSTKRYKYETDTTVRCPNNVAWDTLATWSNSNGWGSLPSSCAARDCTSISSPNELYGTGCTSGYSVAGHQYTTGRFCRYCSATMCATQDSGCSDMPGGYYVDGNCFQCALLAPPNCPDSSFPSLVVYNGGSYMVMCGAVGYVTTTTATTEPYTCTPGLYDYDHSFGGVTVDWSSNTVPAKLKCPDSGTASGYYLQTM